MSNDTSSPCAGSTERRWIIALVGILATIAACFALSIASTVFAPVACAFFIIALAWPAQAALQKRMPQLLALAIVVGIVVVVFLAFASIIAWGFGRIGRYVIVEAAQFQAIYEQATTWLESHGIVVAGIWAEHFNVRWMIRATQEVTGRVNTTVAFWLVVLVYVILGLLEVGPIARKIRSLTSPATVRILIDGSAITAEKFRRYMVIRTIMSFATGALVWVLAAAYGLPLAKEWGVIAFVLNYIPFIGPFIATVFPTLFALAQFASLQTALVVFAGLNVIQFVIGSYIEPRVSGKALSISPFVVLFAVFFWTYLWGLFGAFIGVPIAIALLTYCAQHPSSRWIADLFGDPDKEPAA
jgi:predicted PurR-regulated permease PerM